MSGNRNILLCTLGASWAVIPEVYGFLAPESLPLYRHHPSLAEFEALRREYGLDAPDEIWICTTCGGRTREGVAALSAWRALLDRPPIVRVWQADGTDELAGRAECERFRELLLRACLLAHERAGEGQVVLSLAGGRKTMSADLQWAGYLLGCRALIHVVGREPLPAMLREAAPASFVGPLPADIASFVAPLVAGRGRRSELLDVTMDGSGPVAAARFPLPLADSRDALVWPMPADALLDDELRRRERAGSQLLGNYLEALAREERHENWRTLYRLPPRLIETLRRTSLTPDLAGWLEELPKADLHRHVGGCLDLAAQREVGRAVWSAMSGAERHRALHWAEGLLGRRQWPWDWAERLRRVPVRAHGAAALLAHATEEQLQWNLYGATEPRIALKDEHPAGFEAYERPGELSGSALLAHPAAIEPYAFHVVRQAAAEGLAYVELRGSPQKYGDGPGFLKAFHQGIRKALASLPEGQRPVFRFILIVDRRDRARVKEAVDLALRAREELPDFVAGLDLAGNERETPPEAIAADFGPAFEQCLPLTIHAGEGEKADSIWQAAYHLHADRIGHGLTIGDHPRLAARFRDRGVCLELCPTSNREVVGYHDPALPETAGRGVYPLWTLWEAGLPLTLCTDNPGISRTTLAGEYLTAARMAGGRLSCWDALALIKQGFVHAFLPSSEKEALVKRADSRVYRQVLDRFAEAGAGLSG
jgi:adenosine deaminase